MAGRVVVVGTLVGLVAGCGRPTAVLEPEGTVTRTWVGSEAPVPETAEPQPDEARVTPSASTADAPPPRGTAAETGTSDAATPPPVRRGWTKSGAWSR
jgi:hypothetical protein